MEKQTHTLKQSIAMEIERFIYEPASQKLDRKLAELTTLNALAQGHKNLAFMYKGLILAPAAYRAVRGQKLTLLSRTLYDKAEAYLAERRELAREIELAHNYVACLVIEARNEGDLLALTPDFLHKALGDIASHHKPTLLTQEQVDAFNQKNADTIQKLKERLLLNIIES